MAFEQQRMVARKPLPNHDSKDDRTPEPEATSGEQTALRSSSEDDSRGDAAMGVGKKSIARELLQLLSFLVGLCWLAPALYLVYVNITSEIIGASAWCPTGFCPLISYHTTQNTTYFQREQSSNQASRNLQGALQFAAKAFEVWFVFIATSLVYIVTCILARREGGFPVGYLFTHLDYTEFKHLFSPVLWTAPVDAHGRKGGSQHIIHLYMFGLMTAALCIIANLMGPAAAVLMIPSQQWVDTPQIPGQTFDQFLSMSPPNGDNAIPLCNSSQLAARRYNCTAGAYRASLDALVEYYVSERQQSGLRSVDSTNYSNFGAPPTVEGSLSFVFNFTSTMQNSEEVSTYWTPNRQVIRALSNDFDNLANVIYGISNNETYAPFNNSASLILQRQGPITAAELVFNSGNLSITDLGNNKKVRCYEGFEKDNGTGIGAKCFRQGSGWNSTSSFAQFAIDRAGLTNYEVLLSAYWADRAVYIGADHPQSQCLVNGTLPANVTCDWDAIFSNQTTPPDSGRLNDIFVIEATIPHGPDPQRALVAQTFPSIGFATYSLDASTISPALANVEVANPPKLDATQPTVLNADWVLAAWSINPDESVNSTRSSGMFLQQAVVGVLEDILHPGSMGNVNVFSRQWEIIVLYTIMQVNSLVNFNTTSTNSAGSFDDLVHPVLWTNVLRLVWMFGLNSQGSVLSVVVVILGILVVIARSAMMVATRLREHTTVELLVAALECPPHGKFYRRDTHLKLARGRYRLIDRADKAAQLRPLGPALIDEEEADAEGPIVR